MAERIEHQDQEARQRQARETVAPGDPSIPDEERQKMQEEARRRADRSTKEELERGTVRRELQQADERRAD